MAGSPRRALLLVLLALLRLVRGVLTGSPTCDLLYTKQAPERLALLRQAERLWLSFACAPNKVR